MDGLMLDTEIVEFRAWQRASADFGWSMSDEQYLQLIGRNHRDAWAVLASWWEAQPGTRGGLDAIRERAACVVIEDSDSGILAASAAGMTPFLVPDSSIPRVVPPAVRVKAYKTCESLNEVLAILGTASKRDHGPG